MRFFFLFLTFIRSAIGQQQTASVVKRLRFINFKCGFLRDLFFAFKFNIISSSGIFNVFLLIRIHSYTYLGPQHVSCIIVLLSDTPPPLQLKYILSITTFFVCFMHIAPHAATTQQIFETITISKKSNCSLGHPVSYLKFLVLSKKQQHDNI